jgi:GNAT superfamily N-acetyltransferase
MRLRWLGWSPRDDRGRFGGVLVQLRFATMGAAAGWAEVRVAASPYLLGTEASVLHDMEHNTDTLARYVVVEEGRVLGIGRLRRGAGAPPSMMVQVDPAHEGRGVGRLLFQRLLAVAGRTPLTGLVNGDERSLAVAAHWGFEVERAGRVSSVDPRTAPPPPATPAGLRVVPLDAVGARSVWECHHATAADDPSGLTRPLPFEQFLETDWSGPLHRPDLGRAVVDGQAVVAYSQIDVAGERAWSTMTGCLPVRRGQGLATLAKSHLLRALADAGVTRCSTGNDEANAPMLTVNERLGYRPSATTWTTRRAPDPVADRPAAHRP